MHESVHPLFKTLYENKNLIQEVIQDSWRSYTFRIQPKMKFGRPQIDDKGNIKLRYLTPPVSSLKSIQRHICYHLQQTELPESMFGSIKNSNNILNALEQILEVFTTLNFSLEEAQILTNLTTFKGSLPQGAPTSPVLANLAFANTALQLQALVEKYEITFTTFLDDLTFSSTKDFKFLIPDVLKIIRQNKFYPHNKKIHYRKDTCEITGLIVGKRRLKLTTEMQREALKNQGIMTYALTVKKQFESSKNKNSGA